MADVYRLNKLKPLPEDAVVASGVARWRDDGRPTSAKIATDAPTKIIVGKSSCYYGKVKHGATWRRVKLYRDKSASERRLGELQREADQSHVGMRTPDIKAL